MKTLQSVANRAATHLMRHAALLCLVLLTGCPDDTETGNAGTDAGTDSAGTQDLGDNPDLSDNPDLGDTPDLGTTGDLGDNPDLDTTTDLGDTPDLTDPPDLGTQCPPERVLVGSECLPRCDGNQVRGDDGECHACGDNEEARDNRCACVAGYLRSNDVCLAASAPTDTLGSNWHPDPDGDGVSRDRDLCPYAYDPDQTDADEDGLGDPCDPDFAPPTEDGPVTDLYVQHVTPYGAWLHFTSTRSETYGWGGVVVWSEQASDLASLSAVEATVERGDAVSFDIDAPFGDRPERPLILTELNPDTTYYLAVVREDWTGLLDEISNIVTITTALEPPISMAAERPRVMLTPDFVDALEARSSGGDSAWATWVETMGSRVVEAGTNPDGVYVAPQYCQAAATLYFGTGESTYRDAALSLLDLLIAEWEDNVLDGNQYRWANAALGICLDLLWDEVSQETRERALTAMLDDDEVHAFDDPPRRDDTDEFASTARTLIIDGLVGCDASGVAAGLSERSCAVLEAGMRSFFGFQLVKTRRDRGFWAQSGGFLPDGSDYGQGTSTYWVQALWALNNAGLPSEEFAPFVYHNMLSMVLYALSPTGRGYYTQGDVEDFSYNYDLEPSSFQLEDSDSSLLALHMGLLEAAGMTDEASYVRWLIDTYFEPYRGAGTVYRMMFEHDGLTGTDYRETLPTAFLDSGLGLLYDRTSFSEAASMLVFRAGWSGVDHSHEDLGHFQLFRAGRWMTHEAIAYDGPAARAQGHNVLLLQQAAGEDTEDCVCQRLGRAAGDARMVRTSSGAAHTFAAADLAPCYRSFYYHSEYYDAVQRSLLWLKSDEGGAADRLVVYDLVDNDASAPSDLTRVWQLQLDAAPAIDGRRATSLVTTPTEGAVDEQLDVVVALPATAGLSVIEPVGVPDNYPGPLYNYRLQVEAGHDEPELRYVTVLRAGPTGAPALAVTAIETETVVGVLVGSDVVVFPKAPLAEEPEGLGSLSFTVDTEAPVTLWVTGLMPGADYDVTVTTSEAGLAVQVSEGAALTADQGGLVAVAVDAGLVVTPVY